MANGIKDIKIRIKAAKNVGKITKAMELVSVSKMKRAVEYVLQSRAYSKESWRIIKKLARFASAHNSPLLGSNIESKKICIIFFASDRGLCGTFHTRLFEKLVNFESLWDKSFAFDYITVGNKAQDYVAKSKRHLIANFQYKKAFPSHEDIMPVSHLAIEAYKRGEYNKVFLLYTDYESAVRQTTRMYQLLPFLEQKEDEELGRVTKTETDPHFTRDVKEVIKENGSEMLFEPNKKSVFNRIVPRILEMQVYHAALESAASEHASRMLSMQNATKAAKDMVDSLTLFWNQARQASITREIAEISAGKAVLE